MKAYRYNSKKREDRKFNNCGKEKNPNAIKFYACSIDYADRYKYIRDEDGDIIYECNLEEIEISNVSLFDMANNYMSLSTYKNYISTEIGRQKEFYTRLMNEAKKAKERKMWAKSIDNLKNREEELISHLFCTEFQTLSDFERQNELVSELKTLGFEGYYTKNEIAIF